MLENKKQFHQGIFSAWGRDESLVVPNQLNKADVATSCTLCCRRASPEERLLFSLPNLVFFHVSFPVVGLGGLRSIAP